jgi:hypothetical protein
MADELDKRTQSLIDNVKKINKGLSDEVKSIAERQKDDFQAALNARAFKKQVNAMLKDDSFVKMANAVTQAEEAVRKTQNKLQETLDNDETLKQKRKFNVLLERQLQTMTLTEAERIEKVKAFNEHLQSINEREEVIRSQYNTLIEKQQAKHQQLSAEYEKVEEERIDKLKKLSDSGKFTTFADSIKELSGGLLDIGSAFDDATKKFNAAKNLFGVLATPLTWTGKKLFGLGKQVDETSDDLKESNKLQKTNNRQLATTNKRMKMFNLSLLGSIAKFALMGAAVFGLVKFLNDKFGLFGSPEKVEDVTDVASGAAGAGRAAVQGMNESKKDFEKRTRTISNAEKTIAKNEKWIANNEEKLAKTKTDRDKARIQKTIDQQKLEVENAKKLKELELDKGSKPTTSQKVVNKLNSAPKWLMNKMAKGATIAAVGLTGYELWNNLQEKEQNLQTAEKMFAEGLLTGEELNKVREVLMKKIMVENTATIAGNVSYFAIGATATSRTARSMKGLAKSPYTAAAVGAVSLGTGIAATLAAQKIFDFANIDDALKLMYDPEGVLDKIGITPDTPGYEEFLANNKKFREQWENSTAVGPNGEAFLRKLAPGETAQSLGRKIQFGKGGSGVRMTNKELRDQIMQPLISTAANDFEKKKLENQKSLNSFLSPDPGSLADFKETFKKDFMLAKPNASADEIKAYVDANFEKAYEMKKAEYERGQNPVNVINSVNQNSSFSLGTAVDTSTGLSSYNQLDGTIQSRLSLP